jgi:hypothetical protein
MRSDTNKISAFLNDGSPPESKKEEPRKYNMSPSMRGGVQSENFMFMGSVHLGSNSYDPGQGMNFGK